MYDCKYLMIKYVAKITHNTQKKHLPAQKFIAKNLYGSFFVVYTTNFANR